MIIDSGKTVPGTSRRGRRPPGRKFRRNCMKTNRLIIAALAITMFFSVGSSAIAQDRLAGYTGHAAGTPTGEPPAELRSQGVYHPTGNECRAMSEFSQKTGIILKLGRPLENDQPLWQYTPEGARWTWAPKGMRFWVDMNDPNEVPLFAGPLPEDLRTASDRDTGCCNAVSVTPPPAPQAPPPPPPPAPVVGAPPPPPPPAQPPVWQFQKEYTTQAGDPIRPVPAFSFTVKSLDGAFARTAQNDERGLAEVPLAGAGCYKFQEGKSAIARFAGSIPEGSQECFAAGETKRTFVKNVQVIPAAAAPPVYHAPEAPAKAESSFPWKPLLVIAGIGGVAAVIYAATRGNSSTLEPKPPTPVTRPATSGLTIMAGPTRGGFVGGFNFSFGRR